MKNYLRHWAATLLILASLVIGASAVTTYTYPKRLHLSGTEDQAEMDAILNLFMQKTGDTATGDIATTGGNLKVNTAGKGVVIKTGSNARLGTASLAGTSLVVSNSSVTANTKVFVTRASNDGTLGHLGITSSAGVSFTINSSVNETNSINWMLIEAIP